MLRATNQSESVEGRKQKPSLGQDCAHLLQVIYIVSGDL